MTVQEYYKSMGVIHSSECKVCRGIKKTSRMSYFKRAGDVFWALVGILAVSYIIVGILT